MLGVLGLLFCGYLLVPLGSNTATNKWETKSKVRANHVAIVYKIATISYRVFHCTVFLQAVTKIGRPHPTRGTSTSPNAVGDTQFGHASTTTKKKGRPRSTTDTSSLRAEMGRCSERVGLEPVGPNFEKSVEFASKFMSAYQSVVPSTFLPSVKNPCWLSNMSQSAIKQLKQWSLGSNIGSDEQLVSALFQRRSKRNTLRLCLPYFFVAGFPKSATTTLDNILRKHPEIIGPSNKEPHWWTRGPHVNANSTASLLLSVALYLVNFAPLSNTIVPSHLITYDASQSTLWHSPLGIPADYCLLPAVMSRVVPWARFVVLMRDPVERLISHYIWTCKYHNGPDPENWPKEVLRNGGQLLHERALKLVQHYRECEENGSLASCTPIPEDSGSTACGTINHRLGIGLYYHHLVKWLQFYPREQFLFLRMEDFIHNPYQVLEQLTEFLGVETMSQGTVKKWMAERLNTRTAQQDALFHIRPETRALIKDFYAPHNLLLSKLLLDRKFLWKDIH